ncbi:helix-turn-helix transcriptional regulator [Streptomyces sp. DSM 41524]|uniref:Helix-turn-helix transcriptional regulator n=1 Tax=Streptomyces asiaticus subsp. ignotus TaxID=3098222 RepID=A0ABU7Q280_9ACTN|nr:helix-turn-helix transcriptional regulator [Streptomyces sp. DSM 41524]
MNTTYDGGPAPLILGAYLRALRQAKGLKLCDAAEFIRSSAAKLSRMETGQVAQQWQDVSTLLRFYGVTDCSTIVGALRWSGQQSRAPMQRLGVTPFGPRILAAPFQTGVIPPSGTLHRYQLHGHEVFAEETRSALYTTGADSQAARRCMAAGLAAAKDPEASAALLDIARRRFEQLARDPESDPLLEELTA